jgi:hypothetical protein
MTSFLALKSEGLIYKEKEYCFIKLKKVLSVSVLIMEKFIL